MKLHIKLDRSVDAVFKQMADEANLPLKDMAEVSIYGVIASYMKDRGINVESAPSDTQDTSVS